jgi:hypothetical protein
MIARGASLNYGKGHTVSQAEERVLIGTDIIKRGADAYPVGRDHRKQGLALEAGITESKD